MPYVYGLVFSLTFLCFSLGHYGPITPSRENANLLMKNSEQEASHEVNSLICMQ